MPIPEAVRAAVEKADSDWNSLYGEPKVVNAPDPVELAAALEAEHQPAPTEAPKAQEQPAPQESQPQPTPAQANEQPAPQPDPWEHRYQVLKGKFDAELPQLKQQLAQRDTTIQSLERRVQELEAVKGQLERVESLKLTPEEESAFGKDLIELTRKVAANEAERVQREIAAKLEKTEATVQTVSKTAEQTAHARFLSDVTTAVPDWQVVDARPDWLEWLGQYDPLLGAVRQTALDQATNMRDAGRVAALFNAFKATLPAPVPAPTPTQAASTVQQQVAPRTQAASSNQSTPSKRLYTEADLQALFSANRRGEYTREQWAVISAEIDNAVAEGRVR